MTEMFAGSKMDRDSGVVMLVATALALLAGVALGLPSVDVLFTGLMLILGFVVLNLAVWLLRLRRVGRLGSNTDEWLERESHPLIEWSVTLWIGLAGANMILFLAGLFALVTGLGSWTVLAGFIYVSGAAILSQCIVGILINAALLRHAAADAVPTHET